MSYLLIFSLAQVHVQICMRTELTTVLILTSVLSLTQILLGNYVIMMDFYSVQMYLSYLFTYLSENSTVHVCLCVSMCLYLLV